ncbi:MAG: hypothetical protein O2858_09260 [Proteobacteria bacterium]|jgi:hypothetical protein|nr:hypothetical protein [Pseudomonadota bacterium]MDA0958511.1 hypothetical protein [Pseudomonadota bacterium]MDA1207853.1 hypothetical protein [Pseudomonadota bacterium]
MRTGIFWNKEKTQVLVYWDGEVVATYPDMEAFVTSHIALVEALDAAQQNILDQEYLP